MRIDFHAFSVNESHKVISSPPELPYQPIGTAHLTQVYDEFCTELSQLLSPPQFLSVAKMYGYIEWQYQRCGLIGKGYHCLEHSLELAVLVLKCLKREPHSPSVFSRESVLPVLVAALLHDYDLLSYGRVPNIKRTIYLIENDIFLGEPMRQLGIDAQDIALMVARTEYPFTVAAETDWKNKLLKSFPNPIERDKFIRRAEVLALMDKAATYYYLSPENARIRVEYLAKELDVPREEMLSKTFDIMTRENLVIVSQWLPEIYGRRWALVRKYFRSLSDYTANMVH